MFCARRRAADAWRDEIARTCRSIVIVAPAIVVLLSSFGVGAVELPSTDAAFDDEAIVAAADAGDELADAELPPNPTAAESAAVGHDDLWFISTRRARYSASGSSGLRVYRYAGPQGWRTASLDDLSAADPSLPTCFHVHGNRVSYAHSNCGGWQFYTKLTGCAVDRKPLRFVIFTWPSDRIRGSQRDDVRAKAVVAECHSYHLAYIVDRLPPHAQISLIGYSYGARLVGGALHQLGGGAVRGRGLAEREQVEPRHVRAVFLAGALDSGSFLPGCTFAAAPTQIDYLLVSRNSADHVLRWYPALYHFTLRPTRSGPQAMGKVGVAGTGCLPSLREHLEYVDVTCLVGDVHDWHGLEHCRGAMLERMRACVTFAPLGDEPPAP